MDPPFPPLTPVRLLFSNLKQLLMGSDGEFPPKFKFIGSMHMITFSCIYSQSKIPPHWNISRGQLLAFAANNRKTVININLFSECVFANFTQCHCDFWPILSCHFKQRAPLLTKVLLPCTCTLETIQLLSYQKCLKATTETQIKHNGCSNGCFKKGI